MKKICLILLFFIVFGCANINLESRKPIKLDINMRVDVYQHVVEDVKSINDQIYGSENKDFNSLFFFENAYAFDLDKEIADAVSRRIERVSQFQEYSVKEYIGENKDSFLEVRGDVPGQIKDEVNSFVANENKDRNIICNGTAEKNKTDVATVRKVFFENDYKRAPLGYWFEVNKDGQYIWIKK